jgi:DNA-binding response OmpR family regulator
MTEKPKILVVDDDEPILILMRSILKEFQFDPLVAASGAEALNVAHAQRPDLILLDKNMPGMSGEDLVVRIRETADLRSVPVLILSGEPMESDEIAALGADGAIQKPFDLPDLIKRIRTQLEEKSAIR